MQPGLGGLANKSEDEKVVKLIKDIYGLLNLVFGF